MNIKILNSFLLLSSLFSCSFNSSEFIVDKEIVDNINEYEEIKFFEHNNEKEKSIALSVTVRNDTVFSIFVVPNIKNNSEETLFIPLDCKQIIQLIDNSLYKIQETYVMDSIHRFDIPNTAILGDLSIEMCENRKKHKSYKDMFINSSFYKSLNVVLNRHHIYIKEIFLEDVYPCEQDNIKRSCIISSKNKGKLMANGYLYIDVYKR